MAQVQSNLEKFIEKVLEVQRSKSERDLNDDELRELAAEMGMTDADWAKLQKMYNAHITRARGFTNYKNWEDTLKECEQALALRPHSDEALYLMANAYAGRWKDDKRTADRDAAMRYAELCLQKNPAHGDATWLLSLLRTGDKRNEARQEPRQRPKAYPNQVDMPGAFTILVLGILSAALCWFHDAPSIVLAAIAIFKTSKARKRYRNAPHAFTEHSYWQVNLGFVLALIGLTAAIWLV